MKYFSKLLPTEDEIENGDSVLSQEGNIIHDVVVEDTATHEPEYSTDKGDKNLKLFLCSRDIQVGDKVYAPEYKEGTDVLEEVQNDPWYVLENLYDVKNFKEQNSFKVLGEISPEATWVKEGDEFDEFEKKMFYRNKYGWSSEHPWSEDILEKKYFVTVPCPHCKYLH